MNRKKILLLTALLFMLSLFTVSAQIRAITDNGEEVNLYFDGTWEYIDAIYPKEHVLIEEGGSGKSAEIIINDELLFTLKNGMLTDYRILRSNGRYDGLRLYDNMSGKVRKIGPYEIEYEFHSDRLKRIGKYRIEYEFSSGRVSKIGDYRIEYDFSTDKISRIGNTYFKYSFFNGKLTDVTGKTPGVRISIF